MYEYFIHTTEDVYDILLSGGLDDSYSNEEDVKDGMEKGIYCLYMWNELPKIYDDMKWVYGMKDYMFVIDTSITNLNETYVCNSVDYGSCINHKSDQIMHIKNRKRKVNFNPLKKHILKEMYENLEKKKINRLEKDPSIYIHNHEVIIKGKIPLSYIKAILINHKYINDRDSKKIIKYIEEHKLPIKIIPFAPNTNNFHKYFEII